MGMKLPPALEAQILRRAGKKSSKRAKRHKYNAKRTTVDGIPFSSKKEARRYGELKLLEAAGKITGLELQPVFFLHCPAFGCPDGNGTACVVRYIADFRYVDWTPGRFGETIIEDVKGWKTPEYRLKKKWMKFEHGIEIREI